MTSPSQTLGVTGGIGSGKSYVCSILAQQGAPIFYADDAAKQIMRTHSAVQEELCALLGSEVYDAEGHLVKSVVAAYLCQGEAHSQRVNAIVHPRVEEAWREFVAQHADAPIIYMECALLFEVGWQRLVDKSLLVTCPEEERIARIMERDHIDHTTALKWIALQMPETEKQQLADIAIVNDGKADVAAQLRTLGLLT
ncbi:dephospho-CoA kinase [Ihuprevotella massiliensis]|jgi:dephospho-coA kinase|uniref:dephospho-CoA kinase n=1 Tax=Ihuprevotella massiliensis TaxID=1852368 RepID=UPI00094EDEA2